jgi:hypothetical protein
MRKRPQIANFNLHQPGLPGFTDDSVLERSLKELGKDR